MRRIFFIFTAYFIFLNVFVVFSDESRDLISKEKDKKPIDFVNQTIGAYRHQYEIPGVAVAIVNGEDERVLSYGFADRSKQENVTENTLFEIASVTKVFTTTALAIHVLEGDVGLNDPISDYLPELNSWFGDVSRITLVDLATHTSSLPRVGGDWHTGGPHKVFYFLQKWRPKYPIGTRYAYSNLGFGLLGYVLENVEKRNYEEVIKGDILIPLGMNMTFTEVPNSLLSQYAQGYDVHGRVTIRRPHGPIPGSGALRSTAKDMLKFLKANMGLAGPEELREAMELAKKPYYKVRDHFDMGLGWQRIEHKGTLMIDKNGGVAGFTSYIGWIPEKRLGIVILTNKGGARTTYIGRFILEQLELMQNEN